MSFHKTICLGLFLYRSGIRILSVCANRDTHGKCDAVVCRSIIKAVVVVIIIDSVVKIFL